MYHGGYPQFVDKYKMLKKNLVVLLSRMLAMLLEQHINLEEKCESRIL